jgi:hypothetical protein
VKVDVIQFHPGAKAESKKAGKTLAGFESALRARLDPKERGKAEDRAAKDEKKTRLGTGTEEALLVSRTLTHAARLNPVIGTKTEEHKAEAISTRAKGLHEHTRVTGPAEPKKRPAPIEGDAKDLTRDAPKLEKPEPLAATTAPQSTPEVFRLEAPPAIKEAAPLAQVAPMMLDDASVRAVLLPTVARLSMDTGEAGRLNVQLKVQDGVTDIRAAGPAAALLEARQGELRVALAKEGLAMGHFDLTQSGSQHHHAERPEFDAGTPTARRAAATTSDVAVEDGRVHVKV